MRHTAPPQALPRAPDKRGDEAGLRAVPKPGVRCTTKGCNRKLAERLTGTLTILCDRCKETVTITN